MRKSPDNDRLHAWQFRTRAAWEYIKVFHPAVAQQIVKECDKKFPRKKNRRTDISFIKVGVSHEQS